MTQVIYAYDFTKNLSSFPPLSLLGDRQFLCNKIIISGPFCVGQARTKPKKKLQEIMKDTLIERKAFCV
jgi:hypothetical protein